MRRSIRSGLGLVSVASLTMAMTFPASSESQITGGGFSSDNVEWVANLPQHTGTSGGRLVDGHYYLTDPRGLFIYDVADPTSPQLVGSLLAAQIGTTTVFAQEEPDTNGEILLVDAVAPTSPSPGVRLLVVDVSDETDPHVIGSLGVTDHTWTCILDCAYAIGRTGSVVDLTDPTAPEVVANWRDHVDGDDYMHDFVEVAPGRVIGAGQPSFYLDVTDPLNPVELARVDSDFHSLGYHGAVWPNGATDPLLLLGAEVAPAGATNIAGSDCNDESAHAVATFDATAVVAADEREFNERDPRSRSRGKKRGFEKRREAAEFVKLDEWRIDGRGAYVDGRAPAHTLFCGHWFQPHPAWDAGGILAIAHYDWGTRFLDVATDGSGSMAELGSFQPVGGYTGSVRWISDDLVYVHDYRRGLDILRFTPAEDGDDRSF